MQSTGAHRSHHAIGKPCLTYCQCLAYLCVRWYWPGDGSWKDQNVGTGLHQTLDLMPSNPTDPVCAEPKRKTVQHSNAFISAAHVLVAPPVPVISAPNTT